jgi:hypothetical protein
MADFIRVIEILEPDFFLWKGRQKLVDKLGFTGADGEHMMEEMNSYKFYSNVIKTWVGQHGSSATTGSLQDILSNLDCILVKGILFLTILIQFANL